MQIHCMGLGAHTTAQNVLFSARPIAAAPYHARVVRVHGMAAWAAHHQESTLEFRHKL